MPGVQAFQNTCGGRSEGRSRPGLRCVIVNPSVIIGERDNPFSCRTAHTGHQTGHIPFYVAGGMNIGVRGDVASGMIAAAERGRAGERLHIGRGEPYTQKRSSGGPRRLSAAARHSPRSLSPCFPALEDLWSSFQECSALSRRSRAISPPSRDATSGSPPPKRRKNSGSEQPRSTEQSPQRTNGTGFTGIFDPPCSQKERIDERRQSGPLK